LPAPIKMADERNFENGRISNFQRNVTLTLTLDQGIWHTVMHQSSTLTRTPNFIEIGQKIFEGCISIFFQVQSHVEKSTLKTKAEHNLVGGSN